MDKDMQYIYIPQLPTEVVGVILSNLELLDALNCRFVSKEWDLECLKTLKSSKFRLNLDQTTFGKYLESDPRRQILPFHLKCDIEEDWDEDDKDEYKSGDEGKDKEGDTKKDEVKETEGNKPEENNKIKKKDAKHDDDDEDIDGEINYPPMPPNPNNEDQNDDDDDFQYVYEPPIPPPPNKVFAEFRSNVTRLVELIGPQSIRDLTFIHSGPYEEGYSQKLADFLATISPGLEKLTLQIECELPASGEFNLVFPNLKILWLHCNKASDDENNIIWRLIQACPNLEELRIENISDEHVKGWNDSVPFPPIGLKLLHMGYFEMSWFMEKLRTHPCLTKSLQSLVLERINIIVNQGERDLLQEILNLLSASLISLSIPISISHSGYWDYSDEYHPPELVQVPFPLLPKLKSLRIREFTKRRNHDLRFIIDTEPFPSLEAVDLPHDIILNEDDLTLTFQGVKSLTLRVLDFQDFRRKDPLMSYKTNIDHFLRIFPGVEKLSIKCINCVGGQGIKFVLKGIIQSEGASKIKVLELIGCSANYLGEILEQVQNPPSLILKNIRRTPMMDSKIRDLFSKLTGSVNLEILENFTPDGHVTSVQEINPSVQNYLTNVQKIRLELSAEDRNQIIGGISDDPSTSNKLELKAKLANSKLYLSEMTRNFPQLQEVEISSTMFGIDRIARAKRLERIKEKFPHLIINII